MLLQCVEQWLFHEMLFHDSIRSLKLCVHVLVQPPHPSQRRFSEGFRTHGRDSWETNAHRSLALWPLCNRSFSRPCFPSPRKLVGKCFGSRSHEVTFAALAAAYKGSPLLFAIFWGVTDLLRDCVPAVQSSVDFTSADVNMHILRACVFVCRQEIWT